MHIKSFRCCSLTKLCPTLCDPTDCSMPGFPVLHYLIKFAHTHVHRVSDAIQPSHSHSHCVCQTHSKPSWKVIYSKWTSDFTPETGRSLCMEVKSDLLRLKDFSEIEIFLSFLSNLSTHLLWSSFRSLDSWTLSSGLETSGLFSRRPAGIPRARDIFQTPWRSTPVATTKAGTTKTAMGQAAGTTSRRVWGQPQMSLASSLLPLPLLPIRCNRVVLAFFRRSFLPILCQWQESFLRVSINY